MGRCIAEPVSACAWPATPPLSAERLTALDPDLERNLSGAHWDPATGRLWLVRSVGLGLPGMVFQFVEDGAGGWTYADNGAGDPTRWTLNDDPEGITVVPGMPDHVLVILEALEIVREYDLSGPSPVVIAEYDTSAWLPLSGPSGAEGITFVPDEALQSWGFTDDSGALFTGSVGGMGGLVLVAHQNGGRVYAFDIDRTTREVRQVGQYATGHSESAGLAFDPLTERLYIVHSDAATVEVARLSSTNTGGGAVLDSEYTFVSPTSFNIEGIAVASPSPCDTRRLWLTADDEAELSLLEFSDWPCL